MSTPWLTRIREEHDQLTRRIRLLTAFEDKIEFTRLPNSEQDDLLEQLAVMRAYHKILTRRLARAERESQKAVEDGISFWQKLWGAGVRW